MSKTILSKQTKAIRAQKKALSQLVTASDRLLCRCTTVFPFTFFPDTIIVDQNKIDIVYRNFFFSKSVFTLMIDDVRTVKVNAGPFFATMHFEVIGYEQNPAPVRFLPRRAAFKVRRIIMGLTAAKREGINLDKLATAEVRNQVERIGAAQDKLT